MHTTLNKIHEQCECVRGWNAMLNYLHKSAPDDDPIQMRKVYEAVGLQGAIWALRTLDGAEVEKAEFYKFCKTPATPEEVTIKFLELFGD